MVFNTPPEEHEAAKTHTSRLESKVIPVGQATFLLSSHLSVAGFNTPPDEQLEFAH